MNNGFATRITITACRTMDGTVTCAGHVETGETCPFYGKRRCGTIEMCRYSMEPLNRSGAEQLGWLIPDDGCPFRKDVSDKMIEQHDDGPDKSGQYTSYQAWPEGYVKP